MKAEEVYNQHKNQIRQMTDTTRKTGNIYEDDIYDKKSGTYLFLHTSFTDPTIDIKHKLPFEILEDEINKRHTSCDIFSTNPRDIRIRCIERDKKETIELFNCVSPMISDVEGKLKKYKEISVTLRQIFQPKTREEVRQFHEAFKTSSEITKLSDEFEDSMQRYDDYKSKNCRPVMKLYTGVHIQGKKVIPIK